MEVELNSGNLRNLCRICLGAGDCNLWEHKVCWNNESDVGQRNLQETEEVTVHEVLQMYNDWQHTILDLDNELQVICKGCISELEPHYRYYKRLLAANKQMQQLYDEALQQEGNKGLVTDQVIIEHIALENNVPEFTKIASQHSQPDPIATTEMRTENIDIITLPINESPPKQAQKRKFVKNPKFILTGGVAQLLTHANGVPSLQTVDSLQETSSIGIPQKRKKMEFEQKIPAAQEEKLSDEFHRELDSNETKPARAAIAALSNHIPEERRAAGASVEKIVEALPTNEILAIDAAPNEQFVATNLEKNDSAKVDENAALPFSTLSADDAGRSIYVCKYCPQAFTAPCFLLTHARKSHVCKHCNKAFVKIADLFAHVKQAHQEHKCGICDKELSTHGNLRAHIRRIHGLKTIEMATQFVTKNRTNERLDIIKEDSSDGCGENVYIEEISEPMTAEYLD